MMFSDDQIQLAIQLEAAGLSWRPRRGQFAFDPDGRIRCGSPFQAGVYYFLDFECFEDYFGSLERLAEALVWLPTFEKSRELLATALKPESLLAHVQQGSELVYLYRTLLTVLSNHS